MLVVVNVGVREAVALGVGEAVRLGVGDAVLVGEAVFVEVVVGVGVRDGVVVAVGSGAARLQPVSRIAVIAQQKEEMTRNCLKFFILPASFL